MQVNNQKGFFPILLGILFLLILVGGGAYYLGTQQSKQTTQPSNNPSPVTTNTQPDPNPSPLSNEQNWKTYLNMKYGYQISFPPDKNYEESTDTPGHTNFLLGCFNIYAIPQNGNIPEGIELSKTQLNELENLQEGATKTYSTPNWKGQPDFTYNVNYKKIPPKSISNIDWLSFEITNNWENHGTMNMYFTNKNNYLYLIRMISNGPCYENEPIQMLSTFKFIN